MPYNTAPRCPEPQEDHAGRTTRERKWKHALAYVSQLWRPSNTLEQTHATVSRYAMHLIDLTTGAAYTVQQLLGATASVAWASISGKPTTLAGYGITDAASSTHTHTSASITDASTGGNGGADSGKLAKFDLSGDLLCQSLFANIAVTAGGEDIGDGEIHIASIEGATTKLVGTAGAANVTISFPANSGTLALTTHEHVSANITDASTGGNGAADAGKLAKYSSSGRLNSQQYFHLGQLTSLDNFTVSPVLFVGSYSGINAELDGERIYHLPPLPADEPTQYIPTCILLADDAAAASYGLAIGDLYYTGTKFRVRTA